MYVLVKGDKALIVDPNNSPEALSFLKERQIKEIIVFLTHEHTDHTCGVPLLQSNFKTTVVCSQKCAELISDLKNNSAQMVEMILLFQDQKNGKKTAQEFKKNFVSYEIKADEIFETSLDYYFEGELFHFRSTPGHSQGSCCIIWNNQAVFTGDSLLAEMPVITRFLGGSTKDYHRVTKPFLDALPSNMFILPGHGRSCTMEELRRSVA